MGRTLGSSINPIPNKKAENLFLIQANTIQFHLKEKIRELKSLEELKSSGNSNPTGNSNPLLEK